MVRDSKRYKKDREGKEKLERNEIQINSVQVLYCTITYIALPRELHITVENYLDLDYSEGELTGDQRPNLDQENGN
jgi:hypothetical protein